MRHADALGTDPAPGQLFCCVDLRALRSTRHEKKDGNALGSNQSRIYSNLRATRLIQEPCFESASNSGVHENPKIARLLAMLLPCYRSE